MIAVSDDHSKLRSLGNILMKLDETKPLAQDIIKDCDEVVDRSVTTAVIRPVTTSTVNHLPTANTSVSALGWEPDEHSLDDIRSLLEEAFKELNKRIIVQSIHRGNSIIVICYGPHHLLAALFLEVHYNLTVLMKGFSLIRLTIGHYTVYDKRIRYKVMNNECLAEEIKLADGDECELITLLDYKEGSIFEQDKKLIIIKKRKEYITRTLQTPESKLKVKLLTEGKLINEIFKSKESEAQCFRKLITGREEALVEYKKEIELLQEKISITSVQLLMTQKAKIE
uniref:Uncharacterized protein n=1 Tax=Amphimedon queenslandica TaxID=400682 RepID=A0A1X7T8H5_AMPQE